MMVDPETATERRRRARRARRAPALPAPQPELLARHRTDDPIALAALLLAEWRDHRDLAAIAARHGLTERAARSAIDSELARRGHPCLATIEQEVEASRARWDARRRGEHAPAAACAAPDERIGRSGLCHAVDGPRLPSFPRSNVGTSPAGEHAPPDTRRPIPHDQDPGPVPPATH